MTEEGKRRWTLIIMREGQVNSRTLAMSRGKVLAFGGLAVVALATAFFAAGKWVGDLASRGHAEALEAEVLDLREENAAMAVVAERVEQLEAEYSQLRGVMGGELGASRRDILLPPLSEEDATARRVTEELEAARFVWPVVEQGFVTRTFGDTTSVPGDEHVGVDIAVPAGSYVRTTRGGTVEEAGDDVAYGLFVKVTHDDGISSLYAHNSWLFVSAGDSVEIGEVIALSGNSGRSTAPHLHVEIEREGILVDPLDYLAEGT
jgi:murein DD-endopeptidase MepM/ murein hydrolase activator NlpD